MKQPNPDLPQVGQVAQRPVAATPPRPSVRRILGILDAIPDAALTVRVDGTVSHASSAMRQLTGLEPSTLANKHLTDLVPARHQAAVRLHWRELTEGKPSSYDVEILTADGRSVPVSILQSPLVGTEDFLVILRDASHLRQLERELREASSRLGILSRVGAAVSTTVDLDELLQVLYQETTAVMEADAFFVALYHRDAGDLEFRLKIDQGKQETPSRLPAEHGLTAIVVESKRPLLLKNLPEAETNLPAGHLWGSMNLPGSVLTVPMLVGDELVGVISVQSYRTDAYDETDLELLSTIAAQVAAVVQNIRLLTSERRQTDLLAGIVRLGAQLASIRDVFALLNTLVVEAASLLDSSPCTALLYDELHQELVVAAAVGFGEDPPLGLRLPTTLPLVQTTLRSAKPLIVPNIDRDAPELRTILMRKDAHAFFAFPMIRSGRVLGVITFSNPSPRTLSAQEIAGGQLLAELAASALETAQIYEESQARVRDLSALTEVGEALNRALSLPETLDVVLRKAMSVVGKTEGTILLRDLPTNTMRMVAHIGMTADRVHEFNTRPVYATEGTFAYLSASGELLEVADAATDPRILRGLHCPPQVTNVPLCSGDSIIGAISLDALPPDDQARSLLLALADLATVAIERAQSYEAERRRAQELSLLYEISRQTTESLDLDQVLQRIARVAVDAVGADAASLNLLTEPGQAQTVASVGLSPRFRGRTTVRPTGVTMTVITTGKPVVVSDAQAEDPIVNPIITQEGMRSFAALPLAGPARVIGAMMVFFRNQRSFSDEDIRLLSTIANQAAVSIENARLFQQEQRRANQLAVFHEVGRHATSTLRLHDILREATTAIHAGFGYFNVDAFLVEDDAAVLVASSGGFASTTQPGYRQQLSKGIVGWAITHDETILSNDVSQHPCYVLGCQQEVVTKSELTVPIRVDGKVIGALDVQSTELNAYRYADAAALTIVADQLALASKNAMTFASLEEEKSRLGLLYDIAAEVNSSLDLDETLHRAVSRITAALNGQIGYAFLVDPASDDLTMRACIVAGAPGAPENVEKRLLKGQGITGWVAATGQSALVDDVTQDARWLYLDDLDRAVRSALSVPLARGNEVLGVITVAHASPGAFRESHLRLVTAIAQQVTVAVSNARLHERVREQSLLDSLTQVCHHGELIRRLEAAVDHAARSGTPTSYIMLDIDHFKEYNDRYGHVTGDMVLKAIVQVIRANIKKADTVGRWGGEEFGIVLPNTDIHQARLVADRIRKTLATTPIRDQSGATTMKPTVSQGISSYPEFTSNAEQLIDQADRSLYRAKARARDEIVTAAD
jgi:diguanylate cyclase (GGDEF)-like protein/PAS domain S-box-containing protein